MASKPVNFSTHVIFHPCHHGTFSPGHSGYQQLEYYTGPSKGANVFQMQQIGQFNLNKVRISYIGLLKANYVNVTYFPLLITGLIQKP